MATAHLLNGYLGVGKTTLARRLEHELPAVRFTHDEWMISTAMIQRSNARNSRTCGAASMRSWSRSGYVACSWGSMSCSTPAFGRVRSATLCMLDSGAGRFGAPRSRDVFGQRCGPGPIVKPLCYNSVWGSLRDTMAVAMI
jgi:hypothetical protein